MTGALHVHGLGLWVRGGRIPEWLAPYAHGSDAVPVANLLQARARGRASLLTRMFAEVIEQATASSPERRATLPMVFGSCYGEMMITGALLEMMHADDGALSPARFQASVHNGAAGVLSIALQNRTFSTCLAAGRGTVAACLEEASAYLACNGGAVLVAIADETMPAFLHSRVQPDPLALAVCLGSEPVVGGARLRLSSVKLQDPDTAVDPGSLQNAHASALPLWQALIARSDLQLRLPALGDRCCMVSVEHGAAS